VTLIVGVALAGNLPELKYEKYRLDNGLEVILHEDHTIPMVAVNVWYHVGSKNEKPGRTGFAHLFEHMMFQGSENHDTDYFLPLQKIGATVNGSTTEDRTNYWENVPADQVELALWLEADRMGYLLPALDQDKLDNQKDVVRNEKRQGDNQPYAKSEEHLLNLMFPGEHPYSWSVIGSMDDLGAATKEDVSEFFKLYYAPNNASLCVAGDFDSAAVKEMIARYFGTIAPGLPVDRMQSWIPVIDGERRAVAEDQVELPRLYMSWHTPGWYQPGDADFDLLANVLSGGKTSRLFKTLVYELQIAQDVRVGQASRELSGTFDITATAAPGHTLAELEAVIDAELAKVLEKGVTKKEVELARTAFEAGFIRRLQRVGGFGGKADQLNRYNTFTGDPGYLEADLARYYEASAKSIQEYARLYLTPSRRAVLHIVPQGSLAATDVVVDRAVMPGSTGAVSFAPPSIQTATLSNGLELYLVEKHDLPLVEIQLNIMSGWSADPAGKPGVAALTADLLDEGTRKMNALEISETAEKLGARMGTFSFFDGSTVSLNLLKSKLESGLALMGAVVQEPTFPVEEFERIKQSYLGRQQQESSQPMMQAIKELQKRVFGTDHPYSQPITGTGTPSSLAALSVEDLVAFHETWYRPNNAVAVVVGDLTMDEATAALEKAFRQWETGDLQRVAVPAVPVYQGPRVVIMDKPGAPQSFVVGGYLGMTRNNPDYEAFNVLNTAFGGQFASRINMNLREDKGYTYGVRSQLASFKEAGIFLITAPVQTQYTKESVFELLKELDDIRGERPVGDEELTDSKNRLIMGFPQQFETIRGVAGGLSGLVRNDLPLDEWQTYVDRISGYGSSDMAAAVDKYLVPDDLVFIIVGDWATIEAGVRELDLGEIEVVRPGQS